MGRIGESGRLLGWALFVALFSALNYTARFVAPPETSNSTVAYHYSSSIAALAQYVTILGIVWLLARGRRDLLALRRPTSWGSAALISVLVIAALVVLSAALAPVLNPEEEQGLVPTHWDSHRVIQFALFAAVVAGVAPIVEELLFRGVGYGLLEPYGRTIAVVVVGVAFALVHGLLEGLPVLMAFGIGLAYVRARTGSVYPCILLHAGFNGAALALGVST